MRLHSSAPMATTQAGPAMATDTCQAAAMDTVTTTSQAMNTQATTMDTHTTADLSTCVKVCQ